MLDVPATSNSDISTLQKESDPEHIADPLADLLLSVAAIIVLVVIAVLPTLSLRPASTANQTRSIAAQTPTFRLDGREVLPFIATWQGLIVGAESLRLVPVNRLFSDDSLAATLQRLLNAGEMPVLLIEPNGLETAFQFEVIADRNGAKRIRQIRVESECTFTTSEAFAPYCRNLGSQPEKQHR